MFESPTCPKCNVAITKVASKDIIIDGGFSGKLRGAAYACPNCKSVLSVGIDPFALKDEIVREVLAGLGRKP
jgi:hypothetical protein